MAGRDAASNSGKFLPAFVILLMLATLLAGTMPMHASAEAWTDSFPGPGLDARWVHGWIGQNGTDPAAVKVRSGGGIYAATYTGTVVADWHGPYIRAGMSPFLDFDVTGKFRCVSQELQINRLLVRLLDSSGAQLYAFGWSDFLSTDSKAEVGLYGTSLSSPIFKTEQSYTYANFYDKDVALSRSGTSLKLTIAGTEVYSGAASQTSASAVEVSFLKLNDECTNDVLDLVAVSVSTAAVEVPSAPTGLSAAAGDRSVSLAWSPPLDPGALPVSGYKVYRGILAGAEEYLTSVAGTTFKDTGLTNGVIYYYRVSALNELGEGDKCAAVSATPMALPGVPASVQALAGAGYVLLSWSPPTDDGGSAVTGYTVYRSTDSTPHLLNTLGPVTSHNDTGLTNGQAYHYWVSATNSIGEGQMSAEAVAVPGSVLAVPTPPRDLQAVPGDGAVRLGWSPPLSSGNLPLQGYRVYREGAGAWSLLATVTGADEYLDSGLVNGVLQTYRVTAVNYMGESDPSNEASATPAGHSVPSAPTGFALVPGNHTVALSWSAPLDNGGSPIQGYLIYRGNVSGGEKLVAQVGLIHAYNDTGLVNNKAFFYKIAAFTVLGEGVAAYGNATPSATSTGGTGETNETVMPDWTDNFTLTSSITTVAVLAIGLAVAFIYMRGGGESSGKGPDKGVDDEAEKDGAEEERGEDPDGDLLPEGGA